LYIMKYKLLWDKVIHNKELNQMKIKFKTIDKALSIYAIK